MSHTPPAAATLENPGSAVFTEIVFPNDANHLGTLFGGRALSIMDMAASVAAMRHCRRPVVTASSNRIDFKTPIKVGMLIECRAEVVREGRTSLTVRVEMLAEDLLTGVRELCTTGEFVLVAIGQDGKPAPLRQPTAAPEPTA